MYVIDNDYMINERALDVRSSLKIKDNASNIAEVFLKQLSFRVYDYVIKNSANFSKRIEIDNYLETDLDRVDDFKRAIAEQTIYVLSNGDLTLMLPDGNFNYNDWLKMRMSPATIDILKNMGLLRSSVSDDELFYDRDSISRLFDPTRNW